MTKFFAFLIIGIVSSLALHADSDPTPINLELHTRGNTNTETPHRIPMRIDLSVSYDSDSHILTVEGDESLDCEVSLWNSADLMVDYSSAVPASFDLSGLPSGTYTVIIENDSWEALGAIEI
ncbi:MAG: hypothetical protein LUD17_00720 [Bacteroidales bacterium]|nr:hypothetical protein [Bacteroidales bacterium]